jgi:gliding motility-associated-like protein
MNKDTASYLFVSASNYYEVLAINNEGCFGRDTIYIDTSSVPQVKIAEEDSLKICAFAGEEIDLSVLKDEGMEIYWNIGSSYNDITVFSAGTYIVTKTNQFSCSGSDTITIISYCKPVVLTMPNVITPNGDGKNDFHIPIESNSEDDEYLMARVSEIKYTVHNRWGKIIYDSEGISPYWDGRNQKSGEEVPGGTYYWMLHYKDASGGDFTLNGFVQLFR